MDKAVVKKIAELIKEPKRIVIISHVNPDGDALGSSLALYNILIQEKHQVSVVTPNEYPSFLAWMKGSKTVLVYTKETAKAAKAMQQADIIFCLDFNDARRMDVAMDEYTGSKAFKILVDHHLDPAVFTDLTISKSEISSTAELIYELVLALNKKHLIKKDVAECLYTGIVTDTGSFSYSCNYVATYLIISELFKLGIDGEQIHRLVYDTYSEDRMRLLGYCLSEKLKVFQKYGTAYISLTKEDLKRFNFQVGDTEGVVNYALSIEGISVAVLFMEREGYIKLSLRSKGNISVETIARKYYDGGGHHNASGGSSYVDMEHTLKEFEKLLPEIMPVK